MFFDEFDSPVGRLILVASDDALHSVLWNKNQMVSRPNASAFVRATIDNKIIQKTKKQLSEYFNGGRKTFDIPIALTGTEFQMKAWRALQTIPYGKTISYKEQAIKLGNKNKARAVGMANNKNPISIIVPCHRVIGNSGKLVGFGGGLDKKAVLLKIEAPL